MRTRSPPGYLCLVPALRLHLALNDGDGAGLAGLFVEELADDLGVVGLQAGQAHLVVPEGLRGLGGGALRVAHQLALRDGHVVADLHGARRAGALLPVPAHLFLQEG